MRKCLRQRAAEQGENIQECIPPSARPSWKGRAHLKKRNDDIRAIKRLGRRQWKEASNDHQRSKAETFMFRYKVIVGGRLQARKSERQKAEASVGCKVLNHTLTIAKPKSGKAA